MRRGRRYRRRIPHDERLFHPTEYVFIDIIRTDMLCWALSGLIIRQSDVDLSLDPRYLPDEYIRGLKKLANLGRRLKEGEVRELALRFERSPGSAYALLSMYRHGRAPLRWYQVKD